MFGFPVLSHLLDWGKGDTAFEAGAESFSVRDVSSATIEEMVLLSRKMWKWLDLWNLEFSMGRRNVGTKWKKCSPPQHINAPLHLAQHDTTPRLLTPLNSINAIRLALLRGREHDFRIRQRDGLVLATQHIR
jgi:hypothetical protein